MNHRSRDHRSAEFNHPHDLEPERPLIEKETSLKRFVPKKDISSDLMITELHVSCLTSGHVVSEERYGSKSFGVSFLLYFSDGPMGLR
ncbi:hypothetical protein TNCT_345011 [Trichonephila clavata]|uniref:Uncharacterized protein n=1 Tax=Trichonephila clavata TaxID=2740835 RepID=A0A8X6GZK6_TRICU|nr:hypothetical protein TNCT_345011 [Trichonephila clavata]